MGQEVQDNQAGRSGPPRGRGTGFPELRLSKAAEYIKSAAQQGARHSPQTLGDYMGHGTASGGAFRSKMASLRLYGFVTGSGDQLTITDDGLLLANADDESQEEEVLARAFLHCDSFRQAFEGTAKNVTVPLKAIGNRAVLEYGVVPSAKERFAKGFADSAVDAGLAAMKGDSVVLRSASPVRHQSETRRSPRQDGVTREVTTHDDEDDTPPTVGGGQPVVLNQSWPFHEGSVQLVVRSSRALPANAYAEIAKVVEAAAALTALLDSGKLQARDSSPPEAHAADEELA